MKSYELATEEARAAAKELASLMRETRATIGDLATRGLKHLDAIPADKHYPSTSCVGQYSDYGYFKERRIIRMVSPKINANRDIDGYPNLTVLGARSRHFERQHTFGRLPSRSDPFSCAVWTAPFSRSPRMLELDLVEKTATYRTEGIPFHVGIQADGQALVDGRVVTSEVPGYGIRSYKTEEEVKEALGYSFAQSLAVGGLVAHGMDAYDLDLPTLPAQDLYNEWRAVQNQEAVIDRAFWMASQVIKCYVPGREL